ncbi:MAG TPA: protein TolA, partial [Betaproteobacteria bacterium]|nr:protein TolA [Betaproteobacteria bacterium]
QRAESREKAKESAVFGTQVQALDNAKATADEAAKVAADRAKKADQ